MYLLCAGIYPNYSIFMKTISKPQTEKLSHYTKCQQSVRKDVERCFRVLQARFAIFTSPARFWDSDMINTVWKVSIILHNMIIEDEQSHDNLENLFGASNQFLHTDETNDLSFDQYLG